MLIETQDEFDYLTSIFRNDSNLTQSGPYIFDYTKTLAVMSTANLLEDGNGEHLDILNGNTLGWSLRLYLVKYR